MKATKTASEFNLIQWQDGLVAKYVKFMGIGKRGRFQLNLLYRKAERELEAVGFPWRQAAKIVTDAQDMAELQLICGGKR